MESKHVHPLKRRWLSFRGFSIQQRLPLLICILLLSVMITFGLISYFAVREIAFKSGTNRLHSQTEPLTALFTQATQAQITSARNTTSQPAISNFLQQKATEQEAITALRDNGKDTSSVLIELMNKDAQVVLRSLRQDLRRDIGLEKFLTAKERTDSGRVGKIYQVKDSMYFPIHAAVTRDSAIIGYLVKWRKMQNNPRSLMQITSLMGTPSAKIYLGNADYSLWTDMGKAVSLKLPALSETKDSILKYNGAEGRMIAAASPIRNTSWLLVTAQPEQPVLEPAREFLGKVIIIAAALIAIGMFIAWQMSSNITRPLHKLTAAASAIASGDYTTAVEVNRRDEVGKLGRAFNAMAVQVSKGKEELEKKIIETQQMNEQLRNLSAHLQNIREEERMHIAREMHDELGQFLTGLKMDIAWLNKKISNGEDSAAKREKLSEMTKLVDDAVIFVRRLAAELRPSILDDLGLIAALEWHSREFNRRFNIEVKFESKSPDLKTSELVATGLFRMYQESLTNVARHAEAKSVAATLEVVDDEIHLSITDDGKGFDTNNSGKRKTLGLLGMKERALMIGGTLEILSKPGNGTTVLICVPLRLESPQKAVLS